MKRSISMILVLAVLCSVSAAGLAAEPADQLLEDVRGTYDELFTVICDPAYDELWLEDCASVVGDDMAPMCAELLKTACAGTLYGEEAVEAYADAPEEARFDCFFLHGVSQFVFDGNTISGLDENGGTVFSHEYAYAQDFSIAGVMDGYLYETQDEDAGEFRYFFLLPDTPGSTYHIEFRYGSDLDALTEYADGPYAYWLAAGIPADRDEKMVENVIRLFCEENLAEMAEEDAEASPEDGIIEISTAEELAAINENLSGHYVLTADIDLAGMEWTPIGSFPITSGEEEEGAEIPDPELAFTGTFDGAGHTISNLTVGGPDEYCVGLFGCISETEVGNFTLENASATGMIMVSDAVGYSYCSTVHDVTVRNGSVEACSGEYSGEGMYGAVVGAAMASEITDCSAAADITLPDNTANAGIVGGGLELTSVIRCAATGTVTAGNNCYGLGGVSGCGFGAEEFTACTAENVEIRAGSDCYWIGGITGYAGGYDMEEAGVPVTVLTDCAAKNVSVEAGENADGIGEIVGSGFFSEEAAAAYGAPYDAPTVFELVNCTAED